MTSCTKNQATISDPSGQRAGDFPFTLLLIIAALILLLSACSGVSQQITYRASGTASDATVTYRDGEGSLHKETVTLPWEKTIEIGSDTFDFQLIVANTTSTGDVACEILFNEESMMEPTTSSAYVDCNGDVRKEGHSVRYHISAHPIEVSIKEANNTYKEGNYQTALAEVDAVIELAPNFADAYFVRGLIQEALEDDERAMSAYSQAIELDPEYADAYNNRGLVYQKMGNLDAAIADWTAALEINPELVSSYFNRARAYFALEDYAAAKADVLKVQDLSDDPEKLTWAKGALEQLAAAENEAAAEPTETVEPDAPAESAATGGPSAGQWIIFTAVTNSNMVINTLNLENGDTQALSPNTLFNWDAALSPDGKMLAFASSFDGNPEIYVMNVMDASNLTRLTSNPASDYAPAWSPDGSMIAFVSERNGNADIYIISVDGSNSVQVTTDTANDWYPAWNENGTELAFVSDRDGDAEIFIFNLDGTLRQVTENTFYDSDPAWQPNGRFIAFASSPDGEQTDIYVIRPDGSGLAQVTGSPAQDIQPSWSFDSNYILFASDRDGSTMEIYMMDENGNTTRLTYNDTDDRFPAWGPLVSP